MQRETATEHKDLPHEFELGGVGDGTVCQVCAGTQNDARHRAWQLEQSQREQAAAAPGFTRETGS
jgi:hypothetical protein